MEGDRLYGLPLERFVPERDALAKALRASGEREEAGRVAKLRKPSVAAWAVNQLVRTQGRAMTELLAAGDGVAQAHADVVSGSGDGRTLRGAAERQRAAVDALVAAARGLLSSDGHELSPAILDRVADTLHAAALEPEARAQVRHGRLERELRHIGLGVAGLAVALPAGGPAKRAKPTPGKTTQQPSEPKPDLAAARRAARAAEARALRAAERAERALQAAKRNRERAVEELRDAEQALDRAEQEAQAAAQAHRAAAEQLDRATRQ